MTVTLNKINLFVFEFLFSCVLSNSVIGSGIAIIADFGLSNRCIRMYLFVGYHYLSDVIVECTLVFSIF